MSLKVAIHDSPNTFSDRWIQYCRENEINHNVVNCYDSDILNKLRGADLLLWHWHIWEPVSILIAPEILVAAEYMGITTWPDRATCQHYNDKIIQKYLLEAIDAPLAPSHVFYNLRDALDWIEKTDFPKVLKLRCGRQSQNVKLIPNKKEAVRLSKVAFREGFFRENMDEGLYFPDYHITNIFRSLSGKDPKIQSRKSGWLRGLIGSLKSSLRRSSRLLVNVREREKGYLLFQDFLPNNSYDTRIVVVGNRAFGYIRYTKGKDFRASGSGKVEISPEKIDEKCIQIAFDTVRKLQVRSLACDFLMAPNGEPKIIEINYNFPTNTVSKCKGHWDSELGWHEGRMFVEDAILMDLLNEV